MPDDEIRPPDPAPEAPEAEESDAEAASVGAHDDGGGGNAVCPECRQSLTFVPREVFLEFTFQKPR